MGRDRERERGWREGYYNHFVMFRNENNFRLLKGREIERKREKEIEREIERERERQRERERVRVT